MAKVKSGAPAPKSESKAATVATPVKIVQADVPENVFIPADGVFRKPLKEDEFSFDNEIAARKAISTHKLVPSRVEIVPL